MDEYAPAAEYVHLLMAPAWTGLRPRLAAALAGVDPDAGVLLDLGAGTGLGADVLLDTVHRAPLLAVEPSAALRAVLLARLAGRADAERVTVYPGGAADVRLPPRITAVAGMHMIGHLGPDERRDLFTALVPRLAPGAPVLFNVQPPDSAVEVPHSAPSGVVLGGLHYEGTFRAEPVAPDRLRWTMTYRTRDGDTVLTETSTTYEWWVVPMAGLATELATAGLVVAEPDGDLMVARAPGGSS